MKLQTMQEKVSRTLWAASALFIIGLTMTSCSEDEENAAAVGYLCPPAFEVDVTVENLDQTRSVTIERPSDLETKTYFIVKDANGIVKHEGEGLWTEPLVLPVGSYTIEGKYGENGFGAPYLMGQCEGEIVALGQETPEITLTLQNAMAKVSVSADMLVHFTPNATATFTSEGTPHTVGYNTYEFIPAGEDKKLEISLPGTNSAGNDATFTYTLTNPASGTAYDVVCGIETSEGNKPKITLPNQAPGAWNTRLYVTPATFANISEVNQKEVVYEVSTNQTNWNNVLSSECIVGNDKKNYFVVKELTNGQTYYVRARIGNLVSNIQSITVSQGVKTAPVTISHTKDNNNYLNGSKATLDLGFSDILKQYVDAGVLLLNTNLSKSGTPMRSSTSYYAETMEDVTIDSESKWPYLPKGENTYTLQVSYRLINEDDFIDLPALSATSPAPDFSVTLGDSYTSYDKYVAKEIDFANNNCDKETIYNVSASGSVSAELMANSNYSKTDLQVFLDGSKTTYSAQTSTSCTVGDITELTNWKDYVLKATMTFDGVPMDDTKTHKITGLPYSYDFYETDIIPSNWTAINTEWWNTTGRKKRVICRDGSDGYLVSPKFNFTGTVFYTILAQYYDSLANNDIIQMYVGTSTTNKPASTYISHPVKGNMTTGEEHDSYSSSLNLSSTNPYIFIYHNRYNDTSWFFGEAIDYLAIYEFHLKYQ